MSASTNHDTPTPTHQPNVVSIRSIWISAAGLLVLVVLTFLLVAGMCLAFGKASRRSRGGGNPSAVEEEVRPSQAVVAPMNPDLRVELARLRSQEQAWLSQYQWIDRQQGIARIPIDRAMDIVSESGLPRAVGGTLSVEKGIQ